MEDGQLEEALKAVRKGDESAIALLFRTMQPSLVRYLNSHAGDAAEDLASETWLSMAPALVDFEGSISDLRALLFTIARRRVVDHFRKQGRRPRTFYTESIDERPDALNAEEIAIDRLSAQQAVDALVELLPPAQSEVVLLRVLADLDVGQVARVMGRSPGAVRILQHRALRSLAKHFHRQSVTS